MSRVLPIFDLVPGWCWAAAVAFLVLVVLRLDAGLAKAELDARIAEGQLAAMEHMSRLAVEGQKNKALERERVLTAEIERVNDAIEKAQSDLSAAAARADERLRELARPVAICPRQPDADPSPAASAIADADRPGGAGLPDADRAGLIVIDAAARADLARIGASANVTAEALRQCLAGWQAAHVATNAP